jgi:flagellar biogenesis protein FliO
MLSLIFVSQGESAGTLLKGNAVLSGESEDSVFNPDGKGLVAGKRGIVSPLSWPKVAGGGLFGGSQEGPGNLMGSERAAEKDISYFQVVKTLFALVLVIFVILGSLYALKVMMGRGVGRKGGGALIQVLATSFVGPKKAITIVKVAGEHLVLGITNSEISFLSKIENPEAIQQIESHKVTEGMPFVKVFEKIGVMAKKG